MSRVFVSAQAGRQGKSGALPSDDQPWGTTSASVFRGFEPAEMKSCRSMPTFKNACLSLSGVQKINAGADQKYRRSFADFADPAVRTGGAPRHKHEAPYHSGVMIVNTTCNQDQNLHGSRERQRHFPFREESNLRGKRLLHEMSKENCCRDSVASASTVGETLSCYTLPSTVASSHSSSASSQPSRTLTGDSRRVPGGLAKRRWEVNMRAPMQFPRDEEWFNKTYAAEGPAGMSAANCLQLDPNVGGYVERIAQNENLFDGHREHKPRIWKDHGSSTKPPRVPGLHADHMVMHGP